MTMGVMTNNAIAQKHHFISSHDRFNKQLGRMIYAWLAGTTYRE
jgi:hypothetical protein